VNGVYQARGSVHGLELKPDTEVVDATLTVTPLVSETPLKGLFNGTRSVLRGIASGVKNVVAGGSSGESWASGVYVVKIVNVRLSERGDGDAWAGLEEYGEAGESRIKRMDSENERLEWVNVLMDCVNVTYDFDGMRKNSGGVIKGILSDLKRGKEEGEGGLGRLGAIVEGLITRALDGINLQPK
jgi:hypothetical protein